MKKTYVVFVRGLLTSPLKWPFGHIESKLIGPNEVTRVTVLRIVNELCTQPLKFLMFLQRTINEFSSLISPPFFPSYSFSTEPFRIVLLVRNYVKVRRLICAISSRDAVTNIFHNNSLKHRARGCLDTF